MRRLILGSLILIASGFALVVLANSWPVYTDDKAPGRLSEELSSRPRQFEKWYARLHTYETPHKKVADWGRGLVAAGAGFLFAGWLWRLYHRSSKMHSIRMLLIPWLALWAVRIPLTLWYYDVRQERFDYPVWGDSLAIPVFSEMIAWIAGAVISSIVLAFLRIRHPLPARISPVRPQSAAGWFRAIFITCWLGLLGLCVLSGVPNGDEGMVFTAIGAAVILLAFLTADDESHPGRDRSRDPLYRTASIPAAVCRSKEQSKEEPSRQEKVVNN